jgi:hypothetical protein
MSQIRGFGLISGIIGLNQLIIQSVHELTEITIIFDRGLLKGRIMVRTGSILMFDRTIAIWQGQERFIRVQLEIQLHVESFKFGKLVQTAPAAILWSWNQSNSSEHCWTQPNDCIHHIFLSLLILTPSQTKYFVHRKRKWNVVRISWYS